MSIENTKDKAVGRTKQAAGDITDDKSLHREGKVQEAQGSIKQHIDNAKNKVEDAIDDIAHRNK